MRVPTFLFALAASFALAGPAASAGETKDRLVANARSPICRPLRPPRLKVR